MLKAVTGTIIGSDIKNSWGNRGQTADKAFTNSFYDCTNGSGGWVGLDFGVSVLLSSIHYGPRQNFAQRLVGGVFQASDTPDFKSIEVIYTISQPTLTPVTVAVQPSKPYQYIRYVGPNGAYCNISSLSFETQLSDQSQLTLAPFKFLFSDHSRQAPCTIWVDARDITNNLKQVLRWNFGDVGVEQTNPVGGTFNLSTDLSGQVVGHVYDKPGTYTIRLDVTNEDGTILSVTVPVIIEPDGHKHYWFDSINGNDSNDGSEANPLKSDAKFHDLAGKSGTYIHIKEGSTINVTAPVRLNAGCVIEGVSGYPVLNGLGFDCWNGQTKGALIRGITATSPFTVKMAGSQSYRSGTGKLLSVRGQNLAVVDCHFDCLNRAVQMEDDTASGLLVQNCKQLDKFGIESQVISCFGGSILCWVGNTLIGSIWESPTRMADVGGIGFTYEYNDVRNNGYQNKAVLTNRNGCNGVVTNNYFGAMVGATSSIGNKTSSNKGIVYRNNIITEGFDFRQRIDGILVVNNKLTNIYPGVNISFGGDTPGYVRNITIKNNSGTGNSVKIWHSGGKMPEDFKIDAKVQLL